ncbi:MAG TPA: PilZ domain-containing protein [Terriglobia bacterium]|nr:PilZ domain-containing protein [Terriglobia bacterium]
MTTAAERRRSARLWMTIPLRMEGLDSSGRAMEYDGRAIGLNRYGARIQIPRPLDKGQAVRVKSPMGRYEAEFRVVESIASKGENGGEYGVACVDENNNFWGIEFPNSDGPADARVLLECGICHNVALLPLTLSEVEALRSIGMVGLPCQTCAAVCPWRCAELSVPPHQAVEAARNRAEDRSAWFSSVMESVDRGHRRVYMQLPIGIRDSSGNAEITRTENISKCGFCFVSGRKYLTGEILMAVFPLDSIAKKTELPVRIVREQPIEGSDRKFYGATFEART